MPFIDIPASQTFKFTEEDLDADQKGFLHELRDLCTKYCIKRGIYGKKDILSIEYSTIKESTKSGPIYSGEVKINIEL